MIPFGCVLTRQGVSWSSVTRFYGPDQMCGSTATRKSFKSKSCGETHVWFRDVPFFQIQTNFRIQFWTPECFVCRARASWSDENMVVSSSFLDQSRVRYRTPLFVISAPARKFVQRGFLFILFPAVFFYSTANSSQRERASNKNNHEYAEDH